MEGRGKEERGKGKGGERGMGEGGEQGRETARKRGNKRGEADSIQLLRSISQFNSMSCEWSNQECGVVKTAGAWSSNSFWFKSQLGHFLPV